jgi:hypothetical protein
VDKILYLIIVQGGVDWLRLKAGGEGLTRELGILVKETLVKNKTKGRRLTSGQKSETELPVLGFTHAVRNGCVVVIVVRRYLW